MSKRESANRHRAHAGATAYSVSPRRYAPLRRVSEDRGDTELLECGHEIRTPRDMIGQTSAERRRCLPCLEASCEAAGHPLDAERGTTTSCRCGAADGALGHLRWYHGLPETQAVVDLAGAQALHAELPAGGHQPHWHWGPGGEWRIRTRPERAPAR